MKSNLRARSINMATALACLAAGGSPAGSWAESSPSGIKGIYTCIDANGKRLTSDRPIRECIDREQRVLNRDGSQRSVVPPSYTADERTRLEEQQRRRQAELAARQDAIKRDRNLMARFPNEEAHARAREAALDDVRNAVRLSELRLEQIRKDRKPLLDEAEFYVGRSLPGKLRAQLESLDASAEAQETLVQNQRAEVDRINALYDLELDHLRKLWSGAPLGSIPYSPSAASAAPGGLPASGTNAATAATAAGSGAGSERDRSR